MPKIVDREKMQNKILLAFEACVQDKHISQITLRDIAAKANMTHPALLNYFPPKKKFFPPIATTPSSTRRNNAFTGFPAMTSVHIHPRWHI